MLKQIHTKNRQDNSSSTWFSEQALGLIKFNLACIISNVFLLSPKYTKQHTCKNKIFIYTKGGKIHKFNSN